MSNEFFERIYDSGHAIPGSRSVGQLERAMNFILELDHSEDNPYWPTGVIERWRHQFSEDTFLIGQARETAISVGSAALLFANLPDEPRATTNPLFESLNAFKRGLIEGGMGKSTVKALMSREIANVCGESLSKTSYAAARNAEALTELATDLDLLSWRDNAALKAARLGRRYRFGMTEKAVQRLMSDSGKGFVIPVDTSVQKTDR
mgnify:CR=1 FL=1